MPSSHAAGACAHSLAMSDNAHAEFAAHHLRADAQEDICLATYAPSTGANRTTRIIATVELPLEGEREVHGNATIPVPTCCVSPARPPAPGEASFCCTATPAPLAGSA